MAIPLGKNVLVYIENKINHSLKGQEHKFYHHHLQTVAVET